MNIQPVNEPTVAIRPPTSKIHTDPPAKSRKAEGASLNSSAHNNLHNASLRPGQVLLTSETYKALATKGVAVPLYDREALQPGILSLGGTSRLLGGLFYDMVDDYLNKHANDPSKQKWGVIAVGFTKPSEVGGPATTVQNLNAQNGLYTLTKIGMCEDNKNVVSTTKVVGCIKEALCAKTDLEAVLTKIADPGIKIITMSILGKNYSLKADGTGIDFGRPESKAISMDVENPQMPKTAIGILVEGLRQRMLQHPDSTVTVLCCDNLPAPSGSRVKAALLSYATAIESEHSPRPLYRWIRDNVTVPNVMVDRIVPQNKVEWETQIAQKTGGFVDHRPLFTEPDAARHIVIQRPEIPNPKCNFYSDNPLNKIPGVIFAGSDAPLYGVVKEAIVNADHVWSSLMGEFFMGKPNIHEVVSDNFLKGQREQMVKSELIPSLKGSIPVGLDIQDYARVVEARFLNAGLPDPVGRISFEVYGRLPRILKIIDRLDEFSSSRDEPMLPVNRTCDAVAAWIISRAYGKGAFGRPIEWTETEATVQRINDAKSLSNFELNLINHGLDYATQRLFLQMCEAKMFGATSTNEQFKSTMISSIQRMSGIASASAPQ